MPDPLETIPITFVIGGGEAALADYPLPTEAEVLRDVIGPLMEAATAYRNVWSLVPEGCDDPEWWVQSKRASIRAEVMVYLLKMQDCGFGERKPE